MTKTNLMKIKWLQLRKINVNLKHKLSLVLSHSAYCHWPFTGCEVLVSLTLCSPTVCDTCIKWTEWPLLHLSSRVAPFESIPQSGLPCINPTEWPALHQSYRVACLASVLKVKFTWRHYSMVNSSWALPWNSKCQSNSYG